MVRTLLGRQEVGMYFCQKELFENRLHKSPVVGGNIGTLRSLRGKRIGVQKEKGNVGVERSFKDKLKSIHQSWDSMGCGCGHNSVPHGELIERDRSNCRETFRRFLQGLKCVMMML